MPIVDWETALDSTVTVPYSSLSIPEKRDEDGTVAELHLPGDYFIDVSWFAFDGKYTIRLYHECFENLVGKEQTCDTPEQVVEIVRILARRASALRSTKDLLNEAINAFPDQPSSANVISFHSSLDFRNCSHDFGIIEINDRASAKLEIHDAQQTIRLLSATHAHA